VIATYCSVELFHIFRVLFDSNKIPMFGGNCTNCIAVSGAKCSHGDMKVNLLLTFLLPNANVCAGYKGKNPRTVQHV
jgi:hypothetical protein